MQTLSTTTYVLNALLANIREIYPDYAQVYSQNFDYTFSEANERSNAINENSEGVPAIVYNRSPLRPTVLGSRGNRFSAFANDPTKTITDITTYRTAHLEFDFNFSIVDRDIATIESFELEYLSKEGLGRITELDVDFSSVDLGTLRYFITWNTQLSNFITNIDQNNYKSIDGTAKVLGWFVSLVGTSPVITNIKLALDQQFNKTLDTIIIQ